MDRKLMGKKLHELRGNMTQTQVAEAIGITKQAYSQYEMGIRVPKDEFKEKLSELYHRSIGYIFYDEAQ